MGILDWVKSRGKEPSGETVPTKSQGKTQRPEPENEPVPSPIFHTER